MRVFISRKLPGDVHLEVPPGYEVDVWEGAQPPPPETLRQRAAGVDGLLTLLTERVDSALLEAAPRLKVVSNMAVGVDNIDLGACAARGLPVGHTPGVLTDATADFTLALILAASRHVVPADRYVREGRWSTWNPSLFLGRELAGATLGVAGLGPIGAAVARRARGFGMKVLAYNRTPKPGLEAELGLLRVDQATLLGESDVLSLHLALCNETRHWLSARELAAMKEGALLVNAARGGLVDQPALVEALRRGRPAFAALDVTDPEPPPPNSPLLGLPNVLLAPHLGSATQATRERMARLALANLVAGLEGRPLLHDAARPRGG